MRGYSAVPKGTGDHTSSSLPDLLDSIDLQKLNKHLYIFFLEDILSMLLCWVTLHQMHLFTPTVLVRIFQ